MVERFLRPPWTEEGTTWKQAGSTSTASSTTENQTSAWFSLRVAVSVAGIPAPTLLPTAAIAAGRQTPPQPSPLPASSTAVSWVL